MRTKMLLMIAAVMVLASCGNGNSQKADEGQTASLAKVSGIPYSEKTVNPKEGKTVLVVSAIGMGRAGAVKGTQFEKDAYELGKTINKK